MTKQTVLIGLLGATLDSGKGSARWERWRPTVSLCQHQDLLINRFELLCQRKFIALAKTLIDDIATVSPETEVRLTELEMDDPWDFQQVYGVLHDFARRRVRHRTRGVSDSHHHRNARRSDMHVSADGVALLSG